MGVTSLPKTTVFRQSSDKQKLFNYRPILNHFFKSSNIWRNYKQERFMHSARLANTLLKDEESARHNHVLACNVAKFLPI